MNGIKVTENVQRTCDNAIIFCLTHCGVNLKRIGSRLLMAVDRMSNIRR